jgi:hypothetical protein
MTDAGALTPARVYVALSPTRHVMMFDVIHCEQCASYVMCIYVLVLV